MSARKRDPLPKLADVAVGLVNRWADEKAYEDPADYRAAFEKACAKVGAKVESMVLDPWFRAVVVVDGERRWLRQTPDAVQWGRFRRAS